MNRMEKNKKLRDELRQSEQHANRFARKTRNRHEEQAHHFEEDTHRNVENSYENQQQIYQKQPQHHHEHHHFLKHKLDIVQHSLILQYQCGSCRQCRHIPQALN